MTPQEIAQKLIDASQCKTEMNWEQDLPVIGLKVQKSYKCKAGYRVNLNSWFAYCRFIYEKVSGEQIPSCPMIGAGSASRWYGKMAAEAILKKFGEENVSK